MHYHALIVRQGAQEDVVLVALAVDDEVPVGRPDAFLQPAVQFRVVQRSRRGSRSAGFLRAWVSACNSQLAEMPRDENDALAEGICRLGPLLALEFH